MPHLQWTSRPRANQPILIAAFEGWNDAGEAATQAVRFLDEQWAAHPFARIDPEDFYDFTVTRPQVRIDDGLIRTIEWPENTFAHARPHNVPDVILMTGVEPQLKWRTFCGQVIEVATVLRVRLVLTLGSLLADVAHSRPTSVFGTAYDPQVIEALRLEPSRYEGPTGVLGVLHQECRERGINSASLWSTVPSYVPSAPSPKAAMALVDRVCAMLSTTLPLDSLADATVEYEREISDLVAEDPDTVAYVQHLEEQHDTTQIADESADELVSEVERFLRDH